MPPAPGRPGAGEGAARGGVLDAAPRVVEVPEEPEAEAGAEAGPCVKKIERHQQGPPPHRTGPARASALKSQT